MVGFVPGVERQIASARSAQRCRPICIPLSDIERKFLLFRLADRTRSIEAVLHAQRIGETISPWTRDQVANKLSILIDSLRLGRVLIVITPLEKLLIAQGIAENPYFRLMHASDPRLNIRSAPWRRC